MGYEKRSSKPRRKEKCSDPCRDHHKPKQCNPCQPCDPCQKCKNCKKNKCTPCAA